MSNLDRLRALEQRVGEIERRLARMEAAPGDIVEEWLQNAERWAFSLLIVQLQTTMPDFSIAALRDEFLQSQVRFLDVAFRSESPEVETVRAFIEARMKELAEELFPTPTTHVGAI